MDNGFVDRLAQEIRSVDGWHSLGAGALAEALAPFVEREAASALRSSGEVVEELRGLRYVRDYIAASGQDYGIGSYRPDGSGFERNFSNRDDLLCCIDRQIEKLSATPASAWRSIAEGWALVFSDPRDFCASASALIGATYSDPDAAARRFANKSLRGEGMVWGDILAFAPTPPTSTGATP